jgi:hypothetical protein
MRIDLFCRVIDNYGDIGVCWRLARQLVHEHGCEVRLVVDGMAAFAVIAPAINPVLTQQSFLGVQVIAWHAAASLVPTDVVIEAFACDPPALYVEAMALQTPKPVWINLEYLSAEAWVDDIHGMASRHQRLPLTKYFFCPGFTRASGGLVREQLAARTINGACNGEIPSPSGGAKPCPLQIFAFAYPHAPVRALVQGFEAASVPATVTLAEPLIRAQPHWHAAPPVPQTQFDALLARFDVLIVRGEDSFIRAQWAAKPLLWHIYPTDDGAHWVKLDAWLDRYCVGLNASVAVAYRAASHAFNAAASDAAPSPSYALLAQNIDALTAHAAQWRDTLMQQTDLATRLLNFAALRKAENLG